MSHSEQVAKSNYQIHPARGTVEFAQNVLGNIGINFEVIRSKSFFASLLMKCVLGICRY